MKVKEKKEHTLWNFNKLLDSLKNLSTENQATHKNLMLLNQYDL